LIDPFSIRNLFQSEKVLQMSYANYQSVLVHISGKSCVNHRLDIKRTGAKMLSSTSLGTALCSMSVQNGARSYSIPRARSVAYPSTFPVGHSVV
jgi:hypothetical protein